MSSSSSNEGSKVSSTVSIACDISLLQHSVRCGTSALFEFANKNCQWYADSRDHTQNPKTIQKGQHRGLLVHDRVNLGETAYVCVGHARTMFDKTIGDARDRRVERLIESGYVRYQY